MKEMNWCLKAAALLAAPILLTGCSGLDVSLDSLLSPPKLTEYQTAIYNALIQSTGQVELTYPRSGDYRSAFVIYNLDDEPTSEAIVFYRANETPQSEGGLRMSFLDQQDGQWFDLLDRPLAGRDVESVSFSDFGMGINIVVRCSLLGQTEQTVNVLDYDNGVVNELYSGNYSFIESTDMDSDGYSELFLINYDAALGCHNAHLIGCHEDEEGTAFGAISTVPLNTDVVTVQRMSRQRLSENDFLVFLDYSKGSGIFGTQLLRCYGRNLTQVYSEGLTRRNNAYTPTLYSTDIDGDGRLEIPVTSPLPGYENLTVPEQLYTVDWYYADEENRLFTLTRKSSSYVSAGLEYMFYIPVRWQGLVTVERSEGTINLVRYDEEAEILLSIYAQPSSVSAQPPSAEGWQVYGGNDSITVFVNTYGGEMALTEDELASCLVIL